MAPLQGDRIGPFVIKSPLGSGGMGQVYLAEDDNLRREVALKLLRSELAVNQEMRDRFTREAQILASLDHEHIGRIHGAIEDGNYYGLVLQFVPGPTLKEMIASGPLPAEAVLSIASQLIDALEAAHHHQSGRIVHRDLTPANIKVKADGFVVVLDFGLAKLYGDVPNGRMSPIPTHIQSPSGLLIGTPRYMSPEQVRLEQLDQRADIWAFGCVVYEMLTGSPAFPGEDFGEVTASILKEDPDWRLLPSTTTSSIRRMLRRCLARPKDQRYSDIRDVRLDVRDAENEQRPDGVDARTVREVFAYVGFREARTAEELVCLSVARSFEDAQSALDRLRPCLQQQSPDEQPGDDVVAWAERELRTFGDSLQKLQPPGNDRLVQRKTVECYVQLLDWGADETLLTRFCETFCTWLTYRGRKEALRNETLREFAYRLINRLPECPSRMRALNSFEKVLDQIDPAAEHDVSLIWLLVVGHLTALEPSILARLLLKGFHIAVRDWSTFQGTWVSTLTSVLEQDRLGHAERSDLDREISRHVRDIKDSPAKKNEYVTLVGIIARLRRRSCRPPNCYVPQQPLSGILSVLDDAPLHESVPCKVGNVRVAMSGWHPGAWLTGDQPTHHHDWATATLLINEIRYAVQVSGPEPEAAFNNRYNHTYGYRVRFLDGQEEELARLRADEPLT